MTERDIYDLRLRTTVPQYSTYTPLTINPIKEDYNILREGFNNIEEKAEKVAEAKSKIRESASILRKSLHNDAETNKWLNDKVNDSLIKIQEAATYGGLEDAITVGKQEGAAFYDASADARIKANENYTKVLDVAANKLDTGKISQTTYDYFVNTNPFKYSEEHDANGNLVSHTDYKTLSAPLDDVQWHQEAYTMFKIISPKIPTDYHTINADGTGSSRKEQYISRKLILENLQTLFKNNLGLQDRAKQDYNALLWKYNKLKSAANNGDGSAKAEYEMLRKYVEDNYNNIKSFETYVADRIGNEMQQGGETYNMEYKYVSTTEDNQTSTSKNATSGGGQDSNNGTNNTVSTQGVVTQYASQQYQGYTSTQSVANGVPGAE